MDAIMEACHGSRSIRFGAFFRVFTTVALPLRIGTLGIQRHSIVLSLYSINAALLNRPKLVRFAFK